MIFVFSSYGQFIKAIDIPQKQGAPWRFIDFTPENEDIVLISANGTLYLLDPMTGENREEPVNLGLEFSQKGIVDGKLFGNSLVFRNVQNQFYWIDNVSSPIANKFEYVPALSEPDKLDYLLVSRSQRNRSPDLLVIDQSEGFWVIKESTASVQVK